MPGPVSARRDVLSESRGQPQVCQGIFSGKIRSCQVKAAGGDKEFHVRVLGKGVPQVVAGIGIAVF